MIDAYDTCRNRRIRGCLPMCNNSHDVQNGISYDVDFVGWPLHFEFPSYTSEQ